MTSSPQQTAIPDVQSSADTRQLAINKVGIKDIRHPVKVLDKNGGVQHTIANFSMYVGLPHQFKGTHMSRFVEILNAHEREITVEDLLTHRAGPCLRLHVHGPYRPCAREDAGLAAGQSDVVQVGQ